MPPTRTQRHDSLDDGTNSPSKRRSSGKVSDVRSLDWCFKLILSQLPWSAEEEKEFNAAIDRIIKKHLWDEVKNHPLLSARKANGVRSHWNAKVGATQSRAQG